MNPGWWPLTFGWWPSIWIIFAKCFSCSCEILGYVIGSCLLDCSSSLTIAIIVLLKFTVNRVCEISQIILLTSAAIVHFDMIWLVLMCDIPNKHGY